MDLQSHAWRILRKKIADESAYYVDAKGTAIAVPGEYPWKPVHGAAVGCIIKAFEKRAPIKDEENPGAWGGGGFTWTDEHIEKCLRDTLLTIKHKIEHGEALTALTRKPINGTSIPIDNWTDFEKVVGITAGSVAGSFADADLRRRRYARRFVPWDEKDVSKVPAQNIFTFERPVVQGREATSQEWKKGNGTEAGGRTPPLQFWTSQRSKGSVGRNILPSERAKIEMRLSIADASALTYEENAVYASDGTLIRFNQHGTRHVLREELADDLARDMRTPEQHRAEDCVRAILWDITLPCANTPFGAGGEMSQAARGLLDVWRAEDIIGKVVLPHNCTARCTKTKQTSKAKPRLKDQDVPSAPRVRSYLSDSALVYEPEVVYAYHSDRSTWDAENDLGLVRIFRHVTETETYVQKLLSEQPIKVSRADLSGDPWPEAKSIYLYHRELGRMRIAAFVSDTEVYIVKKIRDIGIITRYDDLSAEPWPKEKKKKMKKVLVLTPL
jgi:hypothetical protein